ncbi:hypothetical protein BDP27DRAFT_1442992 [Rhodocollybia butyracea]|uniref:Uncharacterized protein n=1 Tax=Rhodocollybia butyracea TaxID=206335 RepID=A0A9P5Q1E3_9AGAR|nr:hypothetical protein BDP27DRAFT_1442992 [Rhodocollybia butyracea]
MPPKQMLDDDKFRQIEYMTPLESPLKPDCKDLSQEPYDPLSMAYYSATGGSLCTGDLKCYGYVVTSHSGIKFVTQASTEAEALAYYIAFLKNFAPAREWMKQLSLRKDEPYRWPSFAVKSVIKDIKDAERGAAKAAAKAAKASAKAAKAGADKDVSTGDKRKRPLQDVGAIEDHRKV